MTAVLLDTLPPPSTDGVDRVYRQLKGILSVAAEQQAESLLQRRDEVSISSLGRSNASQQRTKTELPAARTASSPARALTYFQLGNPSGCLSFRHSVTLAGG
jgi:hypothetical protein